MGGSSVYDNIKKLHNFLKIHCSTSFWVWQPLFPGNVGIKRPFCAIITAKSPGGERNYGEEQLHQARKAAGQEEQEERAGRKAAVRLWFPGRRKRRPLRVPREGRKKRRSTGSAAWCT